MCKKPFFLISIIMFLCLDTTTANAVLVSHWKFDEGSGNIAYDSANGNHGTIYGATWTNGQINGALSFDGVDDYVNLGSSSSIKPPLPLTISFWIKMNTVGIINGLMGLDDQSSNYYGVWFFVHSDNTLEISYGDGGSKNPWNRRTKYGTTALEADRWYHIAAVLRGPTDMDLYIDAVADAGTYSGTGGILKYSSTGTSGTAQYLNGLMDDVRIYNHALSQSEINELIPEPATLLILGLGGLAVLRKRRA